MNQGKFITVEGGEGAGKTTFIAELEQRLAKAGLNVLITREPGGIPIAENIRQVVLDTRNTAMDARTEALLYAAARRQHLVEKVRPALRNGKVVICDRFVDSSLAYQGYARGLGIEEVWEINRFAVEDTMPDLTLWMDVSPEVGLSRINRAQVREVNRLDLEEMAFHMKVREGYRLLAERSGRRIVRLNAEQPQENILEEGIAALEQRFHWSLKDARI
ncbi:dTMP kinase [Paenibacillus tarimensis]